MLLTFRELIKRFRSRTPVIPTEFGEPVPEFARLQAETNMRLDPVLRRKVERVLIEQFGSEEAGLREARRRYPKAYEVITRP